MIFTELIKFIIKVGITIVACLTCGFLWAVIHSQLFM